MTTISALPAGTNPDGTEPVPADQSGATVRLSVDQLRGYPAGWRIPYATTMLLSTGSGSAGESNVATAFTGHLIGGIVHVPVPVDVSALAVNVAVTGTATAATIALWRCNEDAATLEACSWTVAVQGNVAVGTTGQKTVAAVATLLPGIYFAGVVADGTVTVAAARCLAGPPSRRTGGSYQYVSALQDTTFPYAAVVGNISAANLTQITGAGAGYELVPVFATFTI